MWQAPSQAALVTGEGRERRGLLQTHAFPQPPFGNGKFLPELGWDRGMCCVTPGRVNWQHPVPQHGGHQCPDSDVLSHLRCVSPVSKDTVPQLNTIVTCPGTAALLDTWLDYQGPQIQLLWGWGPAPQAQDTAKPGGPLPPARTAWDHIFLSAQCCTLVLPSLELGAPVDPSPVGWEKWCCGAEEVELWSRRLHESPTEHGGRFEVTVRL